MILLFPKKQGNFIWNNDNILTNVNILALLLFTCTYFISIFQILRLPAKFRYTQAFGTKLKDFEQATRQNPNASILPFARP